LDKWTNGSNYDELTEAEKAEWNKQYSSLMLAAEREKRANAKEQEQSMKLQEQQRLSDMVTELKADGFYGDNSLADWKKLLDRPEIFGANHEALAVSKHAESNGVEDFYNFYKQYENA